ncbi:TupA-like ATPgrasp [Salinihabitans flavidus]|uniref:TupA-like ATPgrasp n=1 Tax=Salinihabitans flavidus TaxID=569882 RepID=A0A1H8U8C7_9RHOB|nr:ATP-grasp fold amidoligase family protein [Salinihabitans flavidus]SEO99094.1 TupA-like ATPgrasp [Salinihabitans flavidus]
MHGVDFDNLLDRLKGRVDRAFGYPALRRRFRKVHGHDPDLRNPKGYAEKVQWRKLNDRNPLFPIAADKLRCREFLRDVLGNTRADAILPQLLHHTDDPDTLPFDRMREGAVIKGSHGSGWCVFCTPGQLLDEAAIRATCRTWLRRRHFGAHMQEWLYSQIPPRIIVEELLGDADAGRPLDLKVHMFGEKIGLIAVFDFRGHPQKQGFYTEYWEESEIRQIAPPRDDLPPLERPPYLEEVCGIAREIGAYFDSVRVDFLIMPDRFWIGELTLYHNSGFSRFGPNGAERTLGDMWHLPVNHGASGT